MARVLIGLAIGLIVGATATWSIRSPESRGSDAETVQPAEPVRPAGQLQQVTTLEDQLSRAQAEIRALSAELTVARRALETALVQTGVSPEELQAQAQEILRMQNAISGPPEDTDDIVERLIAGGFSPQRAAWVGQRLDELMLDMIEQRNEAMRQSQAGVAVPEIGTTPGAKLREDLGDFEYEQYLLALGREPYVNILEVIGGSAAASAGLQAGDRMVYYDGRRVFDFLEITPLTLEGNPGETVVIDILRDGQPIQLAVPRGPLGVRLTSDRTLMLDGVRLP